MPGGAYNFCRISHDREHCSIELQIFSQSGRLGKEQQMRGSTNNNPSLKATVAINFETRFFFTYIDIPTFMPRTSIDFSESSSWQFVLEKVNQSVECLALSIECLVLVSFNALSTSGKSFHSVVLPAWHSLRQVIVQPANIVWLAQSVRAKSLSIPETNKEDAF